MALLAKSPRTSSASRLGLLGAWLLPLVYGIARATPDGYLAGSAPFLAQTLGGTSAFAAPAALCARLCCLLPIGPLALRVALASALALALGSLAVYRAIGTLLRAQGVAADELIALVSLGLSLFFVGLPDLFFQGLRPEGFALTTVLAAFCLERLAYLEASWPAYDLRPLYAAGLCFGGLCACDPLSGFLLLPAALPTLSRVAHAKGYAPVLRGALAALVLFSGGAAYLLVHGDPARALSSLQLSASGLEHGPFALARKLSSQLGLFGIWAAFGAVAALQTAGVRRMATLWTTACLLPLLAHGLFAQAPDLTDGLGAFAYVSASATVLAAALCGALLSPDGVPKPHASRGQLAAAIVLFVLGTLRLHVSAQQSTLTEFSLSDALAGQGVTRWPTRALVLVGDDPQGALLQSFRAESQARPDLQIVTLAALHRPAAVRALLADDPELRGLVRSYLLNGELQASELESLSNRKPVVLDLDPHTPPALFNSLHLSNLAFEVVGPTPSNRAEELLMAGAYQTDLEQLSRAAADSFLDPKTAQLLAAQALSAALFFASHEDRDGAQHAVAQGRKLGPGLIDWDALLQALPAEGSRKAHGPIDVGPWLPRTP